MSTDIDQLRNIGANVFGPFTQQIAQILSDMQSNIDSLTQRIETLENASPSSKSNSTKSTKSTKSDKKSTKSKPKKRLDKKNTKKNTKSETKVDPEPESEPEPEIESQSESKSEEKDTKEDTDAATITKTRGAEKNIKFSFQNDHNIIKQTDNGLGAMKPKFKPGTIRLGKYISKSDGNYAAYKFTFDTKGMGPTPSGYAFGILTKGFNNYTTSNFGQNGCVMVKGNGQYITTDGEFKNDDKENYIHKQIIPFFKDGGIFQSGDTVCMEIDVVDLWVKIWNQTRDDGKVFTVTIPDKPIAPMVYMGGSAKRKMLVSGQVAYKYAE